ncbi:hypothetical protein HBHAL_3554 [Halobacillus halophilus DSM 2266]|uniref:Uncharacterized protein n=1 Tax=Halobacillus halophilus (strain ATCC 35676 / DSM 2266 / JCM 20832 / KCTC 3685 / LMG 17431 / NBRC 102448 / NCIMB 2269) TaxID=866895 RepID=I0JP30_HALH3|nr:hypothetical protein HBHAL_3554 [Halobacillus halophilus DSM 2266]
MAFHVEKQVGWNRGNPVPMSDEDIGTGFLFFLERLRLRFTRGGRK